MTQTTQTSGFARLCALLVPLLLLAVGGLLYLQQAGKLPGSGPAAAEIAALSQSVALNASAASAGNPRSFDTLARNVERLQTLSASGALPGSAALWQRLEHDGTQILNVRGSVNTVQQAARSVTERLPDLSTGASQVLAGAGAPLLIERVEAASINLRQSLLALAEGAGDIDRSTATATASIDYIGQVLGALGGDENADIDIAPLRDNALRAQLEAVNDVFQQVSQSVTAAVQAAPALVTVQESTRALQRTAEGLYEQAISGSGTGGEGGIVSIVRRIGSWLPLLLIGLALLASAVLARAYFQAAKLARSAAMQADQNERNQQAILRLLDELGSLADGDLTVQATVTEDITGAIADSINYAIEALRDLVATINDTAIMVDSAAKQSEAAAQHMTMSARRQATEVGATTDALGAIVASIEEVSGNAERSSDVARHSVDVAHKGGEAVRRTIDGMNTIRETIQETSKRIKRLGESSQEIGNIVELINDIAEQTNILALNASIQASMAGEAGRGFAVVADEVQRLAERSTNATKQIEVLVRTIQADTNEAVVSMERSTTDVVGGALLAENAGAALDEIEQVSNQIASLVQNISGSAREQTAVAADINQRTRNLREISDKTGRETAATAAAIRKLSELASQLRKTVSGFQLPDIGVNSGVLTDGDEDRPPSSTPAAEPPSRAARQA